MMEFFIIFSVFQCFSSALWIFLSLLSIHAISSNLINNRFYESQNFMFLEKLLPAQVNNLNVLFLLSLITSIKDIKKLRGNLFQLLPAFISLCSDPFDL
jgi:hypothetical protein